MSFYRIEINYPEKETDSFASLHRFDDITSDAKITFNETSDILSDNVKYNE